MSGFEREVFASDDPPPAFGLVSVHGDDPPPRPSELEDGSVVISPELTPAQAFEVFAGKSYQSNCTNGRRIPSQEDPIARYFRLRAEVDELEADVSALKGEGATRPNEVIQMSQLHLSLSLPPIMMIHTTDE